jgi:hypothetical protein
MRESEMTLKEKVQIYESFFHQIQLHYAVTMNQGKVLDALNIIDSWSYAHRVGNGQLSDKEQQRMIDKVAERMKEFI